MLIAGAGLLSAASAAGGFQLELEYGPATPMTRQYQKLKHRTNQPWASPQHRKLQAAATHPQPRSLEMGAAEGGVYFVTLQLGTPPRPFRVNIDTGSATLSVPATYAKCPTCDPRFDRGYDDSTSSTSSELSCTDATCGDCANGCGNPAFAQNPAIGELNGQNECRARPAQSCTVCRDTCQYSGDGECDDGSQGGPQYCAIGSDQADCGGGCCPSNCCAHGTNACAFISIYGDGSGVSGKVVRDQVSFGGSGASRLGGLASFGVFDKVHDMDSGGPFETSEMDGIFGIAGGVINDGRMPALDEVLAANGVENVFALCLQGHADTASSWDIGQLDHSKYIGEMKYIGFVHTKGEPGTDFEYYSIPAPHRTQVGSRTLSDVMQDSYDPDRTNWKAGQADGRLIIDSGTSGILLPTDLQQQLVTAVAVGASAQSSGSNFHSK